jgi:hypothetical protein
MKFRPLRSKTLWFGVAGLVPVLWVWRDSTLNRSAISLRRTHGIEASQMYGEVALRHTIWEHPQAKWSFFLEHRELGPRGWEELLSESQRAWWNYQIVGEFVIAWWQIATSYCIIWLAVLCWRLKKAWTRPALGQA